MIRRAAKPSQSAQRDETVLGPSVSLPALLDGGPVADSTFRRFLYDIAVVAGHLESARQYLAGKLGVTSPQYNILMIIARSNGNSGVRVSDVADRLNVTGAFVTNEVKKLVKEHLIAKSSNPDDGRGVLLSLTKGGLERIKAIEPDLLMVNDQLFGTLTQGDFHHLASTIGSLVGVFGQTVAVLRALSVTSGEEEQVMPIASEKVRTKRGS